MQAARAPTLRPDGRVRRRTRARANLRRARLRLRSPREVEGNRGVLIGKSSCSPSGPINLRIASGGVNTKSRCSAANMARMNNFDTLLELSPEKARELGHALVEHLLEYQAR